ncbi:hypothetical protein D3C72_2101460 [compost metagenome]
MQAIFRPFAIDTEILDGGFDFDDPDFTLDRQTDEIGPSPACKRQLRQHRMAHFVQKHLNAATHQHRLVRLAAVD